MSEQEPRADHKTGPPSGPDMQFGHSGSTVEVYNLQEVLRGENRIYDRSDFGGVIERASLDHKSLIYTERQEPCMELTLTIKLDPFRNQQGGYSSLHDPLTDRVKLYPDRKFYERKDTGFSDCHFIVTNDGLRLLVWYNAKKNQIVLTNNLELSGQADPNRKVWVNPPPLQSLEAEKQIEAFGRVMVDLLDKIQGSRLKRTYRFGEKVANLPQAKGLGKKAIEETKADKEKGNTTNGGDKPLEQFEDILSAVEEKVTLNDIGGLEDIKQELHDIALSFSKPEIMTKWGAKRPQGILLYGPSGTGKTMLVEALANEINADLVRIQSSDIYILNGWGILRPKSSNCLRPSEKLRNRQSSYLMNLTQLSV